MQRQMAATEPGATHKHRGDLKGEHVIAGEEEEGVFMPVQGYWHSVQDVAAGCAAYELNEQTSHFPPVPYLNPDVKPL